MDFTKALLVFLTFLLCSFPRLAIAEQSSGPEGIVLKKLVEAKVYPRSECLSAVREEEQEGWTFVAIREKHDKLCGGDPDVSPLLDRFRIKSKTNTIEHYNPLDDDYESFATFLGERKKH